MKFWIFMLLAAAAACRAQIPAATIMVPAPGIPSMHAADLPSPSSLAPEPRAPIPDLPAPSSVPGPGAEKPDSPVIVLPNPDGILDLTGIGQPEAPDGEANPFRIRYHPPAQVRDLPLAVGSVLVGERAGEAAAIINGELYAPGDRLGDMTVAAISADAVELLRGIILLRIPVQDAPTILRLPR